jgi:predicted phage terminase large subunit-like protein
VSRHPGEAATEASVSRPPGDRLHSLLKAALANPSAALSELDKVESEESLLGFVKRAWHVLHPSTPFVSGWAIEAMAEHLEAVTAGEVKKLLINVPPGFCKSMLTNVFWPSWEWGPKKLSHHQYISASYEKGLAIRDMVYARDLLKSEWFAEKWPLSFKADSDGKEFYQLEERGWRFAASVGSGLTGRRGHRIIVDDPHSVKTAESDQERATTAFWFAETLPTRFVDQKNPVMVVIMQRLHEADVSGTIINKLLESQDWTHLCIPMEFERKFVSWTKVPNGTTPAKVRRVKEDAEPIPYYIPDESGELRYRQDPRTEEGELAWPERFDRDSVEDLKAAFRAEGGTYAEAGQLQQRPVPRGGGMFQRKDFGFIDAAPDIRYVWGWDLAATKDGDGAYTAAVKLGRKDGQLIIADVIRFRGSAHEVEQAIIRAASEKFPMSLPQDPGQAGKAQKARITSLLLGRDVQFSPETGSKEDRARPLAAQSEAGNLVLVRGAWNDAFIGEAIGFPRGRYKDQIDAATRALAFLQERERGSSISTVPGMVVT